jgi:hypothetical protein
MVGAGRETAAGTALREAVTGDPDAWPTARSRIVAQFT